MHAGPKKRARGRWRANAAKERTAPERPKLQPPSKPPCLEPTPGTRDSGQTRARARAALRDKRGLWAQPLRESFLTSRPWAGRLPRLASPPPHYPPFHLLETTGWCGSLSLRPAVGLGGMGCFPQATVAALSFPFYYQAIELYVPGFSSRTLSNRRGLGWRETFK